MDDMEVTFFIDSDLTDVIGRMSGEGEGEDTAAPLRFFPLVFSRFYQTCRVFLQWYTEYDNRDGYNIKFTSR